jgi:hypothetical protein
MKVLLLIKPDTKYHRLEWTLLFMYKENHEIDLVIQTPQKLLMVRSNQYLNDIQKNSSLRYDLDKIQI